VTVGNQEKIDYRRKENDFKTQGLPDAERRREGRATNDSPKRRGRKEKHIQGSPTPQKKIASKTGRTVQKFSSGVET